MYFNHIRHIKEMFQDNLFQTVNFHNVNYSFFNLVIDHVLDPSISEQMHCALKDVLEIPNLYSYDNPLEKKLAYDKVDELPSVISNVLAIMNSSKFVLWLENITGVSGLIPDPHYRGGGVHIAKYGGKLDIHIDFNIHPRLKLIRRFNAILFLNSDWKDEWKGHLELWSMDKESMTLCECIRKISPIFDRLVIFDTTIPHGFPDLICCPEDRYRFSLATYYYTAYPPPEDIHATIYLPRPGEKSNLELDELRKKRSIVRYL